MSMYHSAIITQQKSALWDMQHVKSKYLEEVWWKSEKKIIRAT
jgi:hypothetical protein